MTAYEVDGNDPAPKTPGRAMRLWEGLREQIEPQLIIEPMVRLETRYIVSREGPFPEESGALYPKAQDYFQRACRDKANHIVRVQLLYL